jgi:O-acetyl-ADP-ribose deacetylase
VRVLTGDLTTQAVDAIVNAVNRTLLGGGGVDGAIHRAGGPEILVACQELRRTRYPNGLPTGLIRKDCDGLRRRLLIVVPGLQVRRLA